MERINDIEDLRAHANLGNTIFKRKPLTLKRFTGLSAFGVAGLAWNFYPMMVAHFGS